MKRALGAIVCASTLWCGAARADEAGALIVYNEAVKLMEAQRYAEACPRFEASFRLAPTVRTKMAVALCHERAGRIATAWAQYREAVRLAKQANDDVSREAAQSRAATLEARLPRLEIHLAKPAAPITVLLDGETRPAATLDHPLPIDPGPHVLRAEALGKKPFDRTFTVGEGATESITVPELDEVAAPVPAPATKADATRAPMPWWGWGAFGLAAVSAGVGTGFGIAAVAADGDARERCPSSPCRDRDGVDASESADTRAWVANVAIGAAVVFAAVGVVAVVTRKNVASAPSFIVRF